MAYSKVDDVRFIWHRVLTTNLDVDEVASFITQADGLIDAFLSRRYTVPIAATPETTPRIVRDISATLALLDIIDRSPGTAEWVVRKIERAQKLLEMLASGELGIPGVVELTTIGGIQSSTADYIPTFGVQPSLDETVDPQRAEDEADERDM